MHHPVNKMLRLCIFVGCFHTILSFARSSSSSQHRPAFSSVSGTSQDDLWKDDDTTGQSKVITTPSGGTISEESIDRFFALKDALKQQLAKAEEKVQPFEEEIDSLVKKGLDQTQSQFRLFTPSSVPVTPSSVPASETIVSRPPKEMTGVEPELTEVCATISKQIYDANSTESFKLTDKDHEAKVLFFTNHGLLKDSFPPFVIVECGDALILGWRGSSNLMDWTTDFAFAPVSSGRWNKVTESMRTHNGFTSVVESDLSMYEDKILEALKGKKQLVLTGHSLAGGVAQLAHLYIEAQMQQETPWSKFSKSVTCRSVAFSGPMAMLNMDTKHADTTTNKLMKKIANNSCNIIFGCDIVPHAVGDIHYLNEVLTIILPELAMKIPGGFFTRWIFGITQKMDNAYDRIATKYLKDIFPVLVAYHHVGNVIYYKDEVSKPVALRDVVYPNDKKFGLFRDNTEVQLPDPDKDSTIEQLKNAHLFFPTALAYNL